MSVPKSLLAAFVAGLLLSLLRQPLGGDVLGAVAVDPLRSALLRGIGLAAACWIVAPLLGGARRWLVLLCVGLGYAAHALFLQAWWWPSTSLGFALSGFPLFGLALWLSRAEEPSPAREEHGSALLPVALALLAAGATIALEVLARHARSIGLGTPADDGLQGCVVLLLVALSALAFGPWLCGRADAPSGPAREARGSGGLALGACGAAALALVGYEYLRHFEDPALLAAFLDRYGLKFSAIGTWHAHAALGASVFVAPAFALGAAACGARDRTSGAALAVGALLGAFAVPWLHASDVHALDPIAARAAPGGARWIAVGCAVGALGALLVAIELVRRRRALGWAVLALAAGSAAWPWLREQRAVLILSPWQRAQSYPSLVMDLPQGVLTVEPLTDGTPAAFLDRVRLTPNGAEERADRNRLVDSVASLGRPAREARVLFVGQLTPAREHELDALGLADWRWTSPLGEPAREVSAALQGGFERSPQRWLALRDAGQALSGARESEFAPDLALVMPAFGVALSSLAAGRARLGAAPAPRAVPDPGGPVAIALWRDAGADVVPLALGSPLQFSFGGPEEWSVATWLGAPLPARAAAQQDAWLDGSTRGGTRTNWARANGIQRHQPNRMRAHLAGEMLRSNDAQQHPFLRALVGLYGPQAESSPWETDEQQLELEPAVLDALTEAATDGISSAERELWSAMADVLAGKRLPDLVLKHLEPLAKAHAPWPELERAVALAYFEFDMPAEALALLETMAAAAPHDVTLRLEAAAAARMSGDHAREADWLRAADALQPARPDVLRLLGVALVRLGDPQGKQLVRDALLRDPDDSALEPFLGPGPYPPPERGYAPAASHATETPEEHAAHAEEDSH